MTRLCPATQLVLATMLALAGVHTGAAASLVLSNGEIIAGGPSHLQPDPDQPLPAVVWSANPSAAPRAIPQKDIIEIRLPDAELIPEAGPTAMLTMNNGDCLRGQIATLDDQSITLDTRFAGPLTFRRDMVHSLRFSQPLGVLRTPKPADWQLSNTAWSTVGNSLIANEKGYASLAIDYPARFRIGFNVDWKAAPRFEVRFLSDPEGKNTYLLSARSNLLMLSKRTSTEGGFVQRSLDGANVRLEELSDSGSVRLELVADSQTGFIGVLVNDRIVIQCNDPTPLPRNQAKNLLITAETDALRLSGVTISSWDGNAIALNASHLRLEPGARQIVLRNGDIVAFNSLEIRNGQAKARSPHGLVNIPIDRLIAIGMPGPDGNPPTPKRLAGDARFWLADGSHLTFRLDDLKDGKITGFSQQFGTAQFSLAAFQRIELNLYNPAFEPQRSKSTW